MDYAARSGSIREDWPPNFGYKKRAAGELSRVLAQARVIPASRKWCSAEESNRVPRPRFRYSIRMQGPGTSCAGASGSVMSRVPPTMRAPCWSASQEADSELNAAAIELFTCASIICSAAFQPGSSANDFSITSCNCRRPAALTRLKRNCLGALIAGQFGLGQVPDKVYSSCLFRGEL